MADSSIQVSNPLTISNGVPQGSILGHLPFTLCITYNNIVPLDVFFMQMIQFCMSLVNPRLVFHADDIIYTTNVSDYPVIKPLNGTNIHQTLYYINLPNLLQSNTIAVLL